MYIIKYVSKSHRNMRRLFVFENFFYDFILQHSPLANTLTLASDIFVNVIGQCGDYDSS